MQKYLFCGIVARIYECFQEKIYYFEEILLKYSEGVIPVDFLKEKLRVYFVR